jgi:hypothetical protein
MNGPRRLETGTCDQTQGIVSFALLEPVLGMQPIQC